MATKYFCDVCNEEMTVEDYRLPRPNETKIAVPFEGCMCHRCITAFKTIYVQGLIRQAIIEARQDIPKERNR